MSAAKSAAKLLMDAWENGEVLPALPSDCAPANEAEATLINEEIMAVNAHPVGGWKIGATADAAQKAMGLSQPFVGAIRAANVMDSPASFAFSDLNRPVIESEYAYRFAADLPARPEAYSRDEVEAAIGSLIVGVEMPLSRLGAENGLGALGSVADHGGTGYYIIGAEHKDWRAFDAIGTDVTLSFDGAEAGRGTGAGMMGDPVNALVWFVNYMGAKGIGMKAGQFVTTGSCTGVIPAPGPVAAVADFGPAGKVELTLA